MSVFTENIKTDKPEKLIPLAPFKDYAAFIRPTDDTAAVELGKKVAEELKANVIADFERTPEYCEKHGEENPDKMVHVPSFTIINGIVYMTYYANIGEGGENPWEQEARFAYCSLNDPSDLKVFTVQKVHDMVEDQEVKGVYDTILMHLNDKVLYIMWTACTTKYYRFYRTYNIETGEFGPVCVNRFKVGDVVNDMSTDGITTALRENGYGYNRLWSDIGIMQKMSTRVENGETYVYSGAYSGNFTCIIKSKDLITWEYVAQPDTFIHHSQWENATYVLGDKVYYFVRQNECNQGFLTVYDLITKEWAKPVLVQDCQSRSDFIYYEGELYLFHAPRNRDGIGMLKINQEDITKTTVGFVADMNESCFYTFYKMYGDDLYAAWTVDRLHIRLSKFVLKNYL